MHLKRYQRKTVKEALRAAREELGPDAIVLSTREVSAGGLQGLLGLRLVELTAAAERLPASEDRHARQRPVAVRAADEIAARLAAAGLDADLARDVARAVPTDGRRAATPESLRRAMATELAPLSAGADTFVPVEVFVGPPGAGKTTTIAKIAAQEYAGRGRRLHLASADGFRVGAVEQLRLYADILGTGLAVARTPRELDAVLSHTGYPLLLDTAGRSPHDRTSREMLHVIGERPEVRTHLVLSAATAPDVARRTLDLFAHARPSRLVLTRLDEVGSLSPWVSLLRERGIPLSYLGTGQSVPEDLERATPPAVVSWITGDGVGREVRA